MFRNLALIVVSCMCCTSATAGLGVTYDDVLLYLETEIAMKISSPVSGMDRYMGRSLDNLVMLEVIGEKQNISQATLIFAMPDDLQVRSRVIAIMLRFLANTVPEWKEGSDWTAQVWLKFAEGQNVASIHKGRKAITMTLLENVGGVSIVVKEI